MSAIRYFLVVPLLLTSLYAQQLPTKALRADTVKTRPARLVPAGNGSLTANSECIGGSIIVTLRNLSSNTSLSMHDKLFVILNQSFQVVYQPVAGPTGLIAVWSHPPNYREWVWNQQLKDGSQAPVGTYLVVLAVDDDNYDPFITSPQAMLYTTTFKILPGGPKC